MSARPVDRCGVCGSDSLESVLHLGSSPPTCVMQPVGARVATEEHHPLELLRCGECTLVQLSVVVDAGTMFPPEYPYQSGNSRALHENFEDLAEQARRAVGLIADDLVVDIGANDGTLLSKFSGRFQGSRTVGVEPTEQAFRIKGRAYRAFFTQSLAEEIVANHGQAKVVTACNVLAHVDDIDDVMRGIDTLLADDGVLIAENHDLASVADGGQWDTVYHEHLRFFDPYSFNQLLDRYGFGAFEWHDIPTHGGSFRVIASRSGTRLGLLERRYDFDELAHRAWRARRDLRDELLYRDVVFGIGATARATTIINYCGLDVEDIAYVCEVAGSDKIGHYIPGTRIPVIDEAELLHYPDWAAVLFSWHMADIIVPKLRERGYHGEIIVPLPALALA